MKKNMKKMLNVIGLLLGVSYITAYEKILVREELAQ